MFMKIIIIVLGVILMGKIFAWLKGVFISHNEIKNEIENLSEEHIEIKNLLSENGKLAKEHKEIKDLLSENGKLRMNIDKILEMKKIEEKVKDKVQEQNIPIKESISNIILMTEKYAEKVIEITMLKQENKNLKDRIIKLEKVIEKYKDLEEDYEQEL